MIAVISFPREAAWTLANVLHAAWPESSVVRHARYTNCFQPPEALAYALGSFEQTVVVGSVRQVVSLLDGFGGDLRGKDLLCVDPGARWVIRLAGGDRAAELAREVQAVLGATPVLDGTGPLPTDPPPPNASPDVPEDAPVLRVTDQEDPGDGDLLVVPRTLVLGIGASSAAGPAEAMRLLTATLEETGYLRRAIGWIATVEGKGGHPAVRWAARCLNVPVEEHPAELLADVTVPNPSEGVGAAVGTPSVAEAAALASAGVGELVVPKRKSAGTTIAIARAALRGRLATIGLGPGEHDLLVPRALAELRRASAVVGRPEAVEAVASLLRPGTRRVALPAPGAIRTNPGEPKDWPGAATDRAGALLDPAGAAATLASHGHAVALVALGDGSGLTVPPGAYDLHHVPGLPTV